MAPKSKKNVPLVEEATEEPFQVKLRISNALCSIHVIFDQISNKALISLFTNARKYEYTTCSLLKTCQLNVHSKSRGIQAFSWSKSRNR